MQPVSVHIAILAVARDAAPTRAVAESVTAAGHQVVARATVMDSQKVIRDQLTKWIDDANIDVIIVAGGAESTSVSGAMKPLVSETLPGFTDLFRYLAFQEIGASAMLSNAEAARCNTTFVFVLPANEGAVRAALAKLILPQLDSNTTPQNLVTSMPRLREALAEAVPTAITMEKTAGGAGFAPRSPALATPPRGRPVTGANIVSRKQANDDPPTKPIDVAKLEQQIAISEAGSATTRQIDLSKLPRVPPGADDTLSDVPLPEERGRNGRAARPESEPIPPPTKQPLPSIRKPPTEPPPTPRKIQRTEPSAVVPPAKPAPARARPSSSVPIGVPPTIPPSAPTAKPPTVPPRPRTKPPTEPPAARPRPSSQPPVPRTRPPTQPPPARAKPPTDPAASESGPRFDRAETRSVPLGTPTGSIPTVELPEELAAAKPLPIRERTTPATPVTPVVKPPEPATDPVAAVRLPPPRKRESTDLAALVAPSLSRTTGDLPLGEFNYPIKKSGNKVVWLLALVAAGVLGFVAVVFLVPRLTSSDAGAAATPAPAQPAVATATLDAAATAEPTPSVEPIVEPSTEPSTDPEPTPAADPAPTRPTGERPSRPARDGRAAPRTPVVAATGSATPPAVKEPPQEEPEEEPPTSPPISSSDCDEVACVLAKYDRPCCEKYRPKDSDLKPRTAGGIPTELDKMAVRAGVQKIKPRVVACGEKNSDSGTVRISVSVKPDGSVASASVESSPSAALGECVAAALRKAEFAKTVNGGSFTYPFVF